MTAAKKDLQAQARELRQQGLSVNEITRTLGVSKGSVSVWVRDIELTPEQKNANKNKQRFFNSTAPNNKGSQANREYGLAKRRIWQQEGRERAKNGSALHLQACMLYWAEGAKHRNQVIFANSDIEMQQLFVRFLREEMHIENTHMALHIVCHSEDETEKARIARYWCDLLELPLECAQKVQSKTGGTTHINRLPNGVCGVRVHNTQLAMHLYGAIQEYGGFSDETWLF